MSISTGTGDSGETGFFAGGRAPKDDDRIEAYGTVDELNACISVARAAGAPCDDELGEISSRLFDLGCDLATLPASRKKLQLTPRHVEQLESWIHREEASLPPLKSFILPGGCAASAALHLARTVCRRAERRVVTVHQVTGAEETAMIYLNRLSDLLFLYSRKANLDEGVAEIEWHAG